MSDEHIRLDFSFREVAIKLEGDPEIISRYFGQLLEEGFQKIYGQVPVFSRRGEIFDGGNHTENDEFTHPADSNLNQSYDTLCSVKLKELPGPEVEWVLLYCFYSSGFGRSRFTREDILSKYEESERVTPSHKRNLTNNTKALIKNGWISAVTMTDFELTPVGVKMAKRILDRKGPPSKDI